MDKKREVRENEKTICGIWPGQFWNERSRWTLQKLGCEVVAVDEDMDRVEEAADKVSFAMAADVGDPEVIEAMGARNLDGVVVAVSGMEASILATMVSKEIGVPYVITKARNDLHEKVLKKVGQM